jgi:shikimate dehydrogenase
MALESLGAMGWYVPLRAEAGDLESVIPALHRLGFLGLNVTAPLKEKVAPWLLRLDEEATAIGAVNALARSASGYWGTNTDARGFRDAYLAGLKPSRALVLGAGGAARAVLHALLGAGFAPALAARDPAQAAALAARFQVPTLPWRELAEEFPLIVNATGASSPAEVGASPPLPALAPQGLMVDVNYGRPDNYWEKIARDARASFRDGLAMLAAQARYSFILWTQADEVSLTPFQKALALYSRSPSRK